jgi:hypothetical protein
MADERPLETVSIEFKGILRIVERKHLRIRI